MKLTEILFCLPFIYFVGFMIPFLFIGDPYISYRKFKKNRELILKKLKEEYLLTNEEYDNIIEFIKENTENVFQITFWDYLKMFNSPNKSTSFCFEEELDTGENIWILVSSSRCAIYYKNSDKSVFIRNVRSNLCGL